MKMELIKWDSLQGSGHTPMYNPHILPLRSIIFGTLPVISANIKKNYFQHFLCIARTTNILNYFFSKIKTVGVLNFYPFHNNTQFSIFLRITNSCHCYTFVTNTAFVTLQSLEKINNISQNNIHYYEISQHFVKAIK